MDTKKMATHLGRHIQMLINACPLIGDGCAAVNVKDVLFLCVDSFSSSPSIFPRLGSRKGCRASKYNIQADKGKLGLCAGRGPPLLASALRGTHVAYTLSKTCLPVYILGGWSCYMVTKLLL